MQTKFMMFSLLIFLISCLCCALVSSEIFKIKELTLDKCILTANIPQNQDMNNITNYGGGQIKVIVDQLKEIFKDEPKVEIIQVDNTQLISSQSFPSSFAFTVYPKQFKDRTCLILPPASDTSNIAKKSYTGSLVLSLLVQFVNENCFTFRTVSGGISAAGLLEKSIMGNLFHLQSTDTTTTSKCTKVSNNISKEEFFWEYLSRSRPVIIEGGVNNWTALSKWTSEYLRQQYQHKQVHVKLTERGEFEGVESAHLWPGFSEDSIPAEVHRQLPFPDLVVVRPATAEMTFSEFIDLVTIGMNRSRVSAYLEYSSIPGYMPELEADIIEPFSGWGLLERRHLNMWLSDGNTLGKLHFDPFDNFLCQVRGIVLYTNMLYYSLSVHLV